MSEETNVVQMPVAKSGGKMWYASKKVWIAFATMVIGIIASYIKLPTEQILEIISPGIALLTGETTLDLKDMSNNKKLKVMELETRQLEAMAKTSKEAV